MVKSIKDEDNFKMVSWFDWSGEKKTIFLRSSRKGEVNFSS